MIPAFILSSTVRFVLGKERARDLKLCGHQAVALGVSLALLTISSVTFAAGSKNGSTGLVTVNGAVAINQTQAVSGQTLFSGSTISTGEESGSTITLRNAGRLRLDSSTTMVLGFSDASLSGSLSAGSLDCIAPAGVQTEITTANGKIVADPAQPAQFRIQVDECNTNLVVQSGHVGMGTGNNVRWLDAGESLSTADASAVPPPSHHNKKKLGIIIALGAAAAVIIWIIIHNHNNNCTTVVSGTGSSTTCQ